jgi:hypothetical protein
MMCEVRRKIMIDRYWARGSGDGPGKKIYLETDSFR